MYTSLNPLVELLRKLTRYPSGWRGSGSVWSHCSVSDLRERCRGAGSYWDLFRTQDESCTFLKAEISSQMASRTECHPYICEDFSLTWENLSKKNEGSNN